MSVTDLLISVGLIVLVVRQLRGRPLTATGLLWPVALVVWAAFEYLAAIPGDLADWLFTLALAAVGLGLGLSCGVLTRVAPDHGAIVATATPAAAVLWILGMISRLAFGLFALHGGATVIAELSGRLDLHSANTWPTALVVMALCEVCSRTVVLLVKYRRTATSLAASPRPV